MMRDDHRYDAMDAEFWAQRARMPAPTPAGVVHGTPLGGDRCRTAERGIAETLTATHPGARLAAMASRAFLRRAVRALLDLGIRQFLHIGSGPPTLGYVHDITQQAGSDARIIHVDNDPAAVKHGQTILEDNPHAAIIPGDLRQPIRLLRRLYDPRLTRLVDLQQPIALLLVDVTHFLQPADHPDNVVAVYRSALARGSYLVLSHLASENVPAEDLARIQDLYRATGCPPPRPRSRHEVRPFFSGMDVIDPGLVFASQWRPEQSHDQDTRPTIHTDPTLADATLSDAALAGFHVGVGYQANRVRG